jgi:hypothetical protein
MPHYNGTFTESNEEYIIRLEKTVEALKAENADLLQQIGWLETALETEDI